MGFEFADEAQMDTPRSKFRYTMGVGRKVSKLIARAQLKNKAEY